MEIQGYRRRDRYRYGDKGRQREMQDREEYIGRDMGRERDREGQIGIDRNKEGYI